MQPKFDDEAILHGGCLVPTMNRKREKKIKKGTSKQLVGYLLLYLKDHLKTASNYNRDVPNLLRFTL